jgi:hypothetical protein
MLRSTPFPVVSSWLLSVSMVICIGYLSGCGGFRPEPEILNVMMCGVRGHVRSSSSLVTLLPSKTRKGRGRGGRRRPCHCWKQKCMHGL